MTGVDKRLQELDIKLPVPPDPLGAYVPAVRSGHLLYISGQLPLRDGNLIFKGKVGDQVSEEEAYQSARVASINALAVIAKELGGFDRLKQIVKLTGYIASAQGFNAQAAVVNGASDFFFEVLGDAGKHARVAVGVSELPADSPVEIEVIAEIEV
ncbi:MAG: RidA family protein [Candidatus Dadabacteria bacterium]|jgi:enamine deaminase RidA (YjgF/YER057c/UK114 family)|nr:MAG: RidA family protein [Thermodesulfobacteriales bacterium]